MFFVLAAISRHAVPVAVSATRIRADVEYESQNHPEPSPTNNTDDRVVNKDIHQRSKGQEDDAKQWPENGIVKCDSDSISE